ncbi:hypothetical protein ACSNOK_34645, partial [Streptomyces sp. URMC 126]|uniref:hypothetical protein n=1 Tax=Streptomyces sp. URMC 126 TaxID=3423401 RepID=UPI003F1CD20D
VQGGPAAGCTASLAIDEAGLPGGTLAGATVAILLDQEGTYTTQVTVGGQSAVLSSTGLPDFLSFSGDLYDEFLAFSVGFNDFGWTFD